jgi:hypothetical protein
VNATRDTSLANAPERRAELLAVLASHEEDVRFLLNTSTLRPAVSDALWSATWELRLDVIAALDRCEKAEGQARYAHDE